MGEKTAKRRKGGAGDGDAGVLGSLPATRPGRLGAERSARGAAKPKAAATPQATTKTKAAATPQATPKSKPKSKPKATGKAKAATPKASTRATPKARKPAKVTTARPAPATPATPAPEPAEPHRPRPVRAGAPALAESTERARSETQDPLEPGAAPPSGTELVTTAIQAAGELAQIGLKMSGHALKRAVDKLPKP